MHVHLCVRERCVCTQGRMGLDEGIESLGDGVGRGCVAPDMVLGTGLGSVEEQQALVLLSYVFCPITFFLYNCQHCTSMKS